MDKFKGFEEMLDGLIQVRNSMDRAKNEKLLIKWQEKGDYRKGPFSDIVDSVYEEFEELAEALDGPISGPIRVKIRDEARDVVNAIEMLWDVLDLGRL